jgi:hypothetical protein
MWCRYLKHLALTGPKQSLNALAEFPSHDIALETLELYGCNLQGGVGSALPQLTSLLALKFSCDHLLLLLLSPPVRQFTHYPLGSCEIDVLTQPPRVSANRAGPGRPLICEGTFSSWRVRLLPVDLSCAMALEVHHTVMAWNTNSLMSRLYLVPPACHPPSGCDDSIDGVGHGGLPTPSAGSTTACNPVTGLRE